MTTLTAKNRNDLGARQFAFPTQRKEPLENASHVRNAIARFNQVEGVTDAERDAAWKRIQSAASKHGVEMHESSWHQLAAKHSPRKTSKRGPTRAGI
jgi:hypothetical protein